MIAEICLFSEKLEALFHFDLFCAMWLVKRLVTILILLHIYSVTKKYSCEAKGQDSELQPFVGQDVVMYCSSND